MNNQVVCRICLLLVYIAVIFLQNPCGVTFLDLLRLMLRNPQHLQIFPSKSIDSSTDMEINNCLVRYLGSVVIFPPYFRYVVSRLMQNK